MSIASINQAIKSLEEGELIILYDDVDTQIGALVGLANHVSPENIIVMTTIGKGLVCVCVDEAKAKQLDLSLIAKGKTEKGTKNFTVSIDYKTTTTGISAFERADTIKALTSENIQSNDFRKPGHVFPLICTEKDLFNDVNIGDASVYLAKMTSDSSETYTCEILNSSGGMASLTEIIKLSQQYKIQIVNISGILEVKKDEKICSFEGKVIQGKKIGRSIGFPTANLNIDTHPPKLKNGVYGVVVTYMNSKYFGLMNVGVKPTFNQENSTKHYEVYILDFDQYIYDEVIKVDVCYYIREEIGFPNIDQLIYQINKDVEYAKKRFKIELSKAGR